MYQNIISQILNFEEDEDYGKKILNEYMSYENLFRNPTSIEEPVPELFDSIKD